MPDLVTELAERGKALAPQDRSRLVDLLLESLHQPTASEAEAAWGVEIERRLDELDQGEVQAVDAAEVFAKARSIAVNSEAGITTPGAAVEDALATLRHSTRGVAARE